MLLLAERAEAGKYLFLAGSDDAAHQEAIAFYLHRHGRDGWYPLIITWPRNARRAPLGSLPASVRAELDHVGLPQHDPALPPLPHPDRTEGDSRERNRGVICGVPICVAGIAIVVLALVGLYTVAERLSTWLR